MKFENKWFTSVAPGANSVMLANYEDRNTAKILTAIENVETKVENAVTELKTQLLISKG